MKTKYINGITALAFAATLFGASACSDILDEQPRSAYDPTFFTTKRGVEGGITSMYAHLRYIYGNAYYFTFCEIATDEYTIGQSADNNQKENDFTPGYGVKTETSDRADALWGTAFANINTCNGVIDNGEKVGVDPSLIAEARFFRAFDYFQLVQVFGGVPLDLGSGELAFNTAPTRTSVRNTVAEVYARCIIPDLEKAIEDLPETPRLTGTVTKTVARLFLAKACLTYGWWLENPNNIPTYPVADRVDPNGKDKAYYFQKAYDVALEGIENPGIYKLMDSFYDVNVGSNDRNAECMLYADHTEKDEMYNAASFTWGNGAAPENFAFWFINWNHGQIVGETVDENNKVVGKRDLVKRCALQGYGRPWTRMAPTHRVFSHTFADKTNDSRYDGTFQTVLRGNWAREGSKEVVLIADQRIESGDPVLTFLDENDPAVVYPADAKADKSSIGLGTIPGRKGYFYNPENFSRKIYPGIWKNSDYRASLGETGYGDPNGATTRPFVIAKFSELYLVAAEAAVKGATGAKSARDLVNVLRARAGKWTYSNAEAAPVSKDCSQAMVDATPATIDINYILDERSRELFAEGHRIFDLRRTQKWEEYAGKYTIAGFNAFDYTAEEFTRNMEPVHYLSPIPRGQLDAMSMSDAEKKAYQNPGY